MRRRRSRALSNASSSAAERRTPGLRHPRPPDDGLNDAALVGFGGDTFSVPIPELLKGPVQFLGMSYPRYRMFVLLVGLLVLVLLWVLMNHTRLGALIRAGVDDAETVEAMGINIRKVFVVTFALGMALAFALNLALMTNYEMPRLPLYYLPLGALLLWTLGQLAVLGPALRAAAVPPVVATRSV